MANPSDDIAAFLAATPAHGLTVGTNLFCGPVRAATQEGDVIVPHAAVFVDVEDGGAATPYLGVRSSDATVSLSITVRGDPGEAKNTYDRAEVLRKALHLADVPGYYWCTAEDARPEHVGRDDAGCHEYEFAVELRWVE
jgi:hypothetical protein